MSWRRPLSVGLYVLAEALLWFIVLRTLATSAERSRFGELAGSIQAGTRSRDFLEPDRADAARVLAEAAGETATGGAPLLVVLPLAFAAFGLMRLLANTDLPASARAAAGLLVSMVVVTAGVQVAIADGAPWEGGLLAGLTGGSGLVEQIGAAEFVADPDVDSVRGVSNTVTVVGLTLLWLRFLLAGRSAVTFDRVLRSFGIGFGVAVLVALFARALDADVASWLVLPYFVLATLALATAHAARVPEDALAVRRDAPWAVSVLGTVVLLFAISLLFGLLTLFDAQRAFHPAGQVMGTVLAWSLTIVLTPIAWLAEQLLNLIVGEVPARDVGVAIGDVATDRDGSDAQGRVRFPGWVRGIAVAALLFLLYRIGLMLFRRRRTRTEEAYPEARHVGASGGLGGLLRGLMPGPRGRRREARDWLSANRAYRLFGRMQLDSHARGLDRAAAQTAIEFGAEASRRLDAPPFPDIASTFDRLRYGRHEPPDEALARLEGRLSEWELAHPLSEEG